MDTKLVAIKPVTLKPGDPRLNRYQRFELGAAIVGWEYHYQNTAPLGVSGMATGLEIDVQLAGEWGHTGAWSGPSLVGPGQICTISPSELYSTSYRARHAPGLQIGFIYHPDRDESLGNVSGALVVPNRGRLTDRRFVELCRAFHDANARCEAFDARTVRAEVRGFVERHATVAPLDAVLRAKQELDRTFDRPLYMRHFAGIAGLHEATFGQRFAAKFGVAPSRYRLILRLNEAARLTWSEPKLSIARIAEQVGFEDLSYFHRAFQAHFGTTPAAYPHRFARAARPAGV